MAKNTSIVISNTAEKSGSKKTVVEKTYSRRGEKKLPVSH